MDFEARYDMAILGSWSSKINTAATRLARLAVARGLWSGRVKPPPYIKREGHGDRPLENTEIVTSETWATEALIDWSKRDGCND